MFDEHVILGSNFMVLRIDQHLFGGDSLFFKCLKGISLSYMLLV